jgi:hypothetical protein
MSKSGLLSLAVAAGLALAAQSGPAEAVLGAPALKQSAPPLETVVWRCRNYRCVWDPSDPRQGIISTSQKPRPGCVFVQGFLGNWRLRCPD